MRLGQQKNFVAAQNGDKASAFLNATRIKETRLHRSSFSTAGR
jgi:hypothetical protein